ncbi:MAG: homoserine dehydrogenase [Bacteroidia bacterium]
MATKLKIGLFGFGCVGYGLYEVLSKSQGIKADIVKICVKNKNKKRQIDSSYFTFEKQELLDNPDINLIVELIDDAEEAYKIVKYALQSGKHVVTANKKMVANNLKELVELQVKHGVSLLYEASSCGSIPIIRTLEEYYDNELLYSVSGIFNGTSNYILTKTIQENLSYAEALKKAQELGFAETDPTNDVAGFDAKFKAIILASHAFGLFVEPERVLNFGIETVSDSDIRYAKEKGLKIKLVPSIKKHSNGSVSVFVLPQLISPNSYLFNVENEFNGVIVEGAFSDKQFLSGKGAGGHPTGSAVLSDISALSYGYKYEYKKYHQNNNVPFHEDILLHVYLRLNSQEEVAQFGFTEIQEQFGSTDYNYVVGLIPLRSLVKKKQYILEHKLFVALTEKGIQESVAYTESSVRKEELETALVQA